MIKEDIDPFKDKDIISVLGNCKKCGEYGFINKEGLCVKCI